MKTTTGQDILNQAAELAQRTRDKIPQSEQVMLQGFIATEFQSLLDSQSWPELIPAVFNVTAANRQFSKNEGSADPNNPEMGDILWLGERNPETCGTSWSARPVAFSEGDGVVFVETNCTNLWVEYVLPYPGVLFPDLNPGLMALATFLAQTLPRRFRNILAHKAAAHLLGSDGNAAAAGVQFGLAQAALAGEINRLPPLPWWRATACFMRPRGRHHFGQPLCV